MPSQNNDVSGGGMKDTVIHTSSFIHPSCADWFGL